MPARNILVINCGSSSIKFALVNEAQEHFPLSGLAERLGSPEAILHWQQGDERDSLVIAGADHRLALSHLLPYRAARRRWRNCMASAIAWYTAAKYLSGATRLDTISLQAIRQVAPLAPLHNPANLLGIEAAMKLFPGLMQVAVLIPPSTRVCPNTPIATPYRPRCTVSMACAATAFMAPAIATSASKRHR